MPIKEVSLVVKPSGETQCIYDEDVDIACLGPKRRQQRVSQVEPSEELGQRAFDYLWKRGGKEIEALGSNSWWADLTLIAGPVLGPFSKRSQALQAEIVWLKENVLLKNRVEKSHV